MGVIVGQVYLFLSHEKSKCGSVLSLHLPEDCWDVEMKYALKAIY